MTNTKESNMDGCVVGIEAFINETGATLHGKIKENPEDFIVQEISADNEIVAFTDTRDRIPTDAEREALIAKLLSSKPSVQKKEKLEFEEPPQGWRSGLDELLGAERVKQVEAVATHKLEECFLPAPAEFQERVRLQVYIQNCFPGLDCKIVKPDGADRDEKQVIQQQQIRVLLDPLYKKFHLGGMSNENCDRLLTFLRKGASNVAASKGVELVHEDSKEARTTLHRLISKHSSCFKTKTETRRGAQCLVVYFSEKNSKKRKRTQPEIYLRFVLKKTNIEHFTCFEKLARLLHRPPSAFSYAGTKDKGAITYQHVVVQGVKPEELLSINSKTDNDTEAMQHSSIQVGNLEFVGTPMDLGSICGNKFTIVVRNVIDPIATLPSSIKSVKLYGFINYFGFQRVGLPSNTIRQHHIGEKIIAGQWEAVVQLLMTPSDWDTDDAARAKQIYKDAGDIDAALKIMPFNMSVERALLQGLKRYGHVAFERAVQNIPFSRRLMYIHAYQSYLFNVMASFRIHEYGRKVVAGDLIRDIDAGDNPKAVRVVTAEEAKNLNEMKGQSNPLASILLPLPGSNVKYPANDVGRKYMEVMQEHGTNVPLSESGQVKGSYRSLVVSPKDLEWSVDDTCSSDHQTLHISFILSSGSFATMCLREILRTNL